MHCHYQYLYTRIKFQCNLSILISLIDDHVGSGKKSNMGYNWNEYIQRNNVEIKMLLWFITFLTFWTNLYSLYNISENVRHILKQNISSSKDLYTEYNRLNPIKSYPLHFWPDWKRRGQQQPILFLFGKGSKEFGANLKM